MHKLDENVASLKVIDRDEVGRVIKKQDDKEFARYAPPEFKKDARIVAVCGTPSRLANPVQDGWFLSDFYLFKHLFKGLGSGQTWITGVPPQEIVGNYGELLHGNPFCDRRVVLDKGLIKDLGPIIVPAEERLKSTFLEHLRKEASIAKEQSQSLLVCIFGHGSCADEHGIFLGDYRKQPREDRILHMEEFLSAIPANLNVSLFTNACFSGGWSFNKNMNITTLAAAGPSNWSESWAKSQSLSRHCGSIWASMILEALKDEVEQPTEKASIQNEPLPVSVQQKSMASFAEACYSVLLERVDRKGNTHQICFSAQDHDWDRSWTGSSNVPLTKFRDRFEELEVRETTQVHSYTNRDPTKAEIEPTPEELRRWLAADANEDIDLVEHGLRGRFGSVGPASSFVLAQCTRYYMSKPGRDSLACNTSLSGQIYQIRSQSQQNQVDFELLSDVLRTVEYRIAATAAATRLLEAVKVEFPNGKKCYAWNPDIHSPTSLDSQSIQIYEAAGKAIRSANIFPAPYKAGQGLTFAKVHQYVQYALMHWAMAHKKTKKDLEEKVDEMKAVVMSAVEQSKEKVRAVEPVRSRKRKWAASLGKRWNSPVKGRFQTSEGLSSSRGLGSTPPLSSLDSSSFFTADPGKRRSASS
ncbi:hypothetical protein PMIN07_003888 [Paraphaeosphaeria minitans]